MAWLVIYWVEFCSRCQRANVFSARKRNWYWFEELFTKFQKCFKTLQAGQVTWNYHHWSFSKIIWVAWMSCSILWAFLEDLFHPSLINHIDDCYLRNGISANVVLKTQHTLMLRALGSKLKPFHFSLRTFNSEWVYIQKPIFLFWGETLFFFPESLPWRYGCCNGHIRSLAYKTMSSCSFHW